MSASYHIDSSKYTLQEIKDDLLSRDLIPSRQPLKDGLEGNFQILEREGIHTLRDLIAALKKKDMIGELSSRLDISEEYLILLRREANSYLPNPVSLDKFPVQIDGRIHTSLSLPRLVDKVSGKSNYDA